MQSRNKKQKALLLQTCEPKHPPDFYCSKCSPVISMNNLRVKSMSNLLRVLSVIGLRILPFDLLELIHLPNRAIYSYIAQLKRELLVKHFHCDCQHPFSAHSFTAMQRDLMVVGNPDAEICCSLCNSYQELPSQLYDVIYSRCYVGTNIAGKCQHVVLRMDRI